MGTQGKVGATGPRGRQGARGVTGETGQRGATGKTGQKGLTGLTGLRGLRGPLDHADVLEKIVAQFEDAYHQLDAHETLIRQLQHQLEATTRLSVDALRDRTAGRTVK